MIVTVLRENDMFNFILPDKPAGQYNIYTILENNQSEKVAQINCVNNKWKMALENGYEFPINRELSSCDIQENETFLIKNTVTNRFLNIIVESFDEGRADFKKYYIPDSCNISIGRNHDADIRFDSNLMSPNNSHFYFINGYAYIEDCQSINGTYLNGRKITGKVSLNDGDVIYIVGLKIIYAKQILSINNPNNKVSVSKSLKHIIPNLQPLNGKRIDQGVCKNSIMFFRSPRFVDNVIPLSIRLDTPPAPIDIEPVPLAFILGPSITMGMASLLTATFTILNANGDIMRVMPTLSMSFSMLAMTVLWPILTKRYERKKRLKSEKQRRETYTKYLNEIKKEINNQRLSQETIIKTNYPTVESDVRKLIDVDRTLWERTPDDDDFLVIRIGTGRIPMKVNISCSEKKFKVYDDTLESDMYSIANNRYFLEDVPVTIDLKGIVTGVVGDKSLIHNFLNLLVLRLVINHSYDECKIIAIYDKCDEAQFGYLKYIPHCWSDDEGIRYIATTQNELKTITNGLSKIIEERKSQASPGHGEHYSTQYVILAISRRITEYDVTIKGLIESKQNFGICVVTPYEELKFIPKESKQIVYLKASEQQLYVINGSGSHKVPFNVDGCNTDMYKVARKISNIKLDKGKTTYSMPTLITFLEMFGVGKVEYLNCESRWKEHDSSISLETEIGVNEQGENFILNLHEKCHGPHGLVAGMTGSGKSELIMSLILSLAVNYHPYDVSFILIDFKGGGMAKAFEKLPHTVGIITNLDGAEIKRSLASINSELKHRQALFAAAAHRSNESNIDIYKYQQLFKSGIVSEPLPHLFIISDEFAELKTQYPDFMAQLISAARIGRSLGVHLILATQKPYGVVDDQIWSNSKFRICLKVQEKSDSQDVIKRPDAAELYITGRFYLQVGYNELFETGQSAWSGAPYYPCDSVIVKKDDNLVTIDNTGRSVLNIPPDINKNNLTRDGKQIDKIVGYISDIVKSENIMIRQMWKEPLSTHISIDKVCNGVVKQQNSYEAKAIVGLVDDPSNQAQFPLEINLSKNGNVLIYGVSGSGRTTMLSTIIYQLISNYSPDLINLFIIDCGSGILNCFRDAPHVGAVLSASDSSNVEMLFKALKKELMLRKQIFSQYGGDYSSYMKSGKSGYPNIVVVINNYSGFNEIYGDKEETIASISREGAKYGIYFIIATTAGGSIRNKVSQNFKQSYVLQMNDRVEYSAVLGSTGGVYPMNTAGRGIFKVGQDSFEFQVAYIHDSNDYNRLMYIKAECENMLNTCCGKKPQMILEIDRKLTYDGFVRYCENLSKDKQIPIGINDATDEVMYIRFSSTGIFPILSQSNLQIGFLRQLVKLIGKTNFTVKVFDGDNKIKIESMAEQKIYSDLSTISLEISSWIDLMIERHQKKKNSVVHSESDLAPMMVIFNALSSIVSVLSDEMKSRLYDVLENAHQLGCMIIICGNVSSLTQFAAQKWYRTKLNRSDGIWLGKGYNQQNIFTVARPSNTTDLNSDSCYLLQKGQIVEGRRLIDDKDEFRGDI